jgi:hypothetical protein
MKKVLQSMAFLLALIHILAECEISNENASIGSHDKPLLVCRGLLTTYEKPTMNSEYEFIVATSASFIRGGELEEGYAALS